MLVIISKKVFDSKMHVLRRRVHAAGLSRLLYHSINGPFAIMSAWKGNVQENPSMLGSNKENDAILRDLIAEMGYGFVRLYGLYAYAGPDQGRKAANEESLFIPGISKEEAQLLAQTADQDTFIWGDKGKWSLFNSRSGDVEWDVSGDVQTDFRMIGDEEDPDFASNVSSPVKYDGDGRIIRHWTDEKGQERNLRMWRLDDSRTKSKAREQTIAPDQLTASKKDFRYLFASADIERPPCQVFCELAGIMYAPSYPGGPKPNQCDVYIPLQKLW